MHANPVDFEAELNPEQLVAATHINGPLLILAGAGSGKTRVITYRIAHLVQKIDVEPWRILAVTFTNKAAGEMRHRVEELLGPSASEDNAPWVSTFHALCARLLRIHGDAIGIPKRFTISDDADQLQVLRDTIKDLELDVAPGDIRRIWSRIDDAKNKGLDPAAFNDLAVGSDGELQAEIYKGYQDKLRQNGMLDFGDLIMETARMLATCAQVRAQLQRRWRFLMVDEFQDTNPAQYAVLRHLTGENENLVVVGDDDQAIYRWRGATVKNILDFEQDFPKAKVVKLEQNYRSSQLILDAAGAVIQHVERRRDKTLWSERKTGDLLTLFTGRSAREEATWVARSIQRLVARHGLEYDQCAVFYRTNAQGRIFEEQFRAVGMPYQIVGGISFYARKEVKDVLSYLRVAVTPGNSVALKRIINTPRRGIGARTLAKLEALVGPGGLVATLWDALDYVVVAEGAGFSEKQRANIGKLYHLVEDIKLLIGQGTSPAELLRQIIERTDYMEHLEKTEAGSVDDRRQSLDELIETLEPSEDDEGATSVPDLFEFLERTTLEKKAVTDNDEHLDDLGLGNQPIKLMTVHAAKGLEFDAVFVVGLEEELFPLLLEKNEQDESEFQEKMDEERRLFYVAITRGRHRVFLSNARTRIVHGKPKLDLRSSRFLHDIPEELLVFAPESSKRKARWGWPDPNAQQWLRDRKNAFAMPSYSTSQLPPEPKTEIIDGIEYDPGARAPEQFESTTTQRGTLLSQPKRRSMRAETTTIEYDSTESVVVEYDPGWSSGAMDVAEAPTEDTLIGRLVSHSREGLGEILSVTGAGKMATLRVLFVSGQERTVMRRFVKLM